MNRIIQVTVLIAFLIGITGCRNTTANQKRFDLKGKVVAVEPEKHLVTIAHEEVKDYMPSMTMPFTVPSDADLQILAPDDEVTATLVVDGAQSWLENLVIRKQSANAPEAPGMVEANEGDEVPNYGLVNQDGHEIKLQNYRGKTLLLTFIYTRCPVPEYCTLMSNNFAAVDKQLQQQPAIYDKTHLLSITIDPDYDTPQVLRSYGAAHTERYQDETFAHWEFATGTKDQIKGVAQFFGLRYVQGSDQIVHVLRTVIIGPDGKIAKIYRDNQWKPEDAVKEMERLAAQTN
jgi:protein SCO1/2